MNKLFSSCCAILVFPIYAIGATFTVTNTSNSGAGSLRQAILDANSAPGSNAIHFNIASASKTIFPLSALPAITNTMAIDGTTQPGVSIWPLIEIQGISAGPAVDGLKIMASNCTVAGLAFTRFTGNGLTIVSNGHNVIYQCVFGGGFGFGNTLSGVFITNSPYNQFYINIMADNSQHGVHIGGALAISNYFKENVVGYGAFVSNAGNGQDGFHINAPRNLIGDLSLIGNLISANDGDGVEIVGPGASNNIVSWNVIGLNDFLFPSSRVGNDHGVIINGAPANLVANNVLSGNYISGLSIAGAGAFQNRVVGNLIGVSFFDNGDFGNLGRGVQIYAGASTNFIGGASAGSTNIIARNRQEGVVVFNGTNNSIRQNFIYGNSFGIDLDGNGVTANDDGDPDTGANQLQNFPILAGVTNSVFGIKILGSLNSRPNSSYQVDFFASEVCDSSGHGQGQMHLGSLTVTTGANSNGAIIVTITKDLAGRYITATATDTNGNTSEFSPCVAAVSMVPPETFTVTNTNDAGAGSLRQAILDANAHIADGPDTISFNIPGTGVQTIAPGFRLPFITDSVILDGYTQPGSSANTLEDGFDATLLIRLIGPGLAANGLVLAGGSNVVRGLSISGFQGDGISVIGGGGTRIEGNRITGNHFSGVSLANTPYNQIGGPTPSARNLIASNFFSGISVQGATGNNNLIQRNRIAFNNNYGVIVISGTNNTVRGNSISGGFGIALGTDGGPPNDIGDGDSGPNQLQNYPVLLGATNVVGSVSIYGSLFSSTNASFTLDFYSSVACSSSGHTWLGATNVTTGPTGHVSFVAVFPQLTYGRYITATATDTNGNTSEFSRCVSASSSVAGMTFTVVNTNDSGPGSLRQAIDDANAAVTVADTIAFNIPGAGPHIISPLTPLAVLSDPFTTIDGYTQPGASANTIPGAQANNAVLKIRLDGGTRTGAFDGLKIEGQNCEIRGLAIVRFSGDGIETAAQENINIRGCFIGLDETGAIQGNFANGIFINGAPNTFIGGGGVNQNVISGNGADGILVSSANSIGTEVSQNLIGLGPSGLVARRNSGDGVRILNATECLVYGNVISGNMGDGLEITGPAASGNSIGQNHIGTDYSGSVPLGNGLHGININNSPGNNGLQNHVIAYNGGDGISISGSNPAPTGNVVAATSIFGNGGLGIDLGNNGITLNDVGDGDSGANMRQNFPVLLAVTNSTTNIVIVGTLNSIPNKTYGLDFYANQFRDPTGHGEGQQYIGFRTVGTDASGTVNFLFNIARSPSDPLVGRYISATATDPGENTSEFSVCEIVADSTRLSVSTTQGAGSQQIQIRWPRVAQDCALQSATNLNPPVAWSEVTHGITQDNLTRTFSVTNGHTEANRFFRLSCP